MTDPLDRYFQRSDTGTASPPPPVAEPPSPANDALDSYFHRQDNANGNTVATQNIPPDAAAQAHRDQPQTGIPASMGMSDPRVGRQIAAQRQAQEIFQRSVGVSGFVGQSPVHAAAAADDLPVLERLSNYFRLDTPQGVASWFGVGPEAPPALAQLGHNVAEAFRQQQAAQQDVGYGNGIFNTPLPGSTASLRSTLAATSLLTSPIWGPLDAAIAQPFGISMQNNPTVGTPGSNPLLDLFVPGIGHRRRLTRTEARDYYAGLANVLVNLVPIGGGASELRTPEGFIGGAGRIRPDPLPPGTPLLSDSRGTSAWHPYPVNSDSLVLDTYGNPLSFSEARGAAMWLRQANRNGEHGQVFETFNEASGNATPRFYIRETGRIPELEAAPAPGVDPNVDTARQSQATADAEALAEDTNQVKESALIRRSPELGAQFIDQQLPPGTNIYMPAQALALFYREQNLSVGLDDGLFGHIPGFAQQMAQAVPINGDVVITRGQYLAAVANSPHADALHQIVRSNEAGLSTIEAQDVADHWDSLPDEELGPLFDQVQGQPGANVARLARLMGPQLYSGDTAGITIKEMFQNSVDAVRTMLRSGDIKEGRVHITTDAATRTLTIHDNGTGMTPEILGKQFLEIAGTGKAQGEENTGGFGIAKLVSLYANEGIIVQTLTRQDGVPTYSEMATSGPELYNKLEPGAGSIPITVLRGSEIPRNILAKFPEGHGTHIETVLPKTYTDQSTGAENEIEIPSWAPDELRHSPIFAPIEVRFNSNPLYEVGKHFDPADYSKMANVKFAWGKADVYYKPAKHVWKGLHVLVNGINQFNERLMLSQDEVVPFEIYVDLHPTVRAGEPSYPVQLNRQGLTKSATADIERLYGYIKAVALRDKLAQDAESFGKLQVLKDGQLSEPVDLSPPRTATALPGQELGANTNVEIREGRMLVDGREMPEMTPEELKNALPSLKTFAIEQSRIDPQATLVHSNMSVAVEKPEKPQGDYARRVKAPLDETRRDILDVAQERYGQEFLDTVEFFGSAFRQLRDMVVRRGSIKKDETDFNEEQRAGDLAQVPFDTENAYEDMGQMGVGVSFDPAYRGVNIVIPFNAVFLDIAIPRSQHPVEAAFGFWGTMIHELAHYLVRSHDANFPAEMQDILMRLEALPDGSYEALKQEFVDGVVSHHWPVIEGLSTLARDHDPRPIATSLENGGRESVPDGGAAGDAASVAGPGDTGDGALSKPGAAMHEPVGVSEQGGGDGVDSGQASTETEGASPQAAYQEQKQLLLEDLTAEERARAETIIDAVETAVDNTARAMFLGNLFKDAKSAGMTPRQWKIYSQRVERALAEANEKLIRRVVAQIKRERSPDWRERQEQNLAEVEQELNQRKDLVAYFALRYSQSPLGAPLERMKLSGKLTRMAFGEAVAKRIHSTMYASNGLNPDDAALLLGYRSGQQLIDDLVKIEDAITASGMRTGKDFFKNVARGLAASRTGEELGFDITPESIRSEASAAVNLKITDLLNEEMTQLGELTGLPIDLAAVQQRAREAFGQYTVRQGARLRSFELALARGGRKTEDALLKDDYIAAFHGKQEQLLAHHTLIEAHKFFRLLQRATRRIEGWGRQPHRKGMNQKFLDQMQWLMMTLGFRVRRNADELQRGLKEPFANFIARVSADGEVDDFVPALDPGQTWQDMPVQDFERTFDLLANLARVGRSLEQIIIDGREQNFNELKAEFIAGGAGIPNIPRNPLVGGRKPLRRAALDFINGFDAIFTKIEEMGDSLDNDNPLGVFNRFVINQSVRAADKRGELKRTIFEPISRAFYSIPKGTRFGYGNTLDTPLWDPRDLVVDKDTGAVTSGTKLQMLRGDLLAVMMNMGSQSNIEGVARGYNITVPELETFVHSHATKGEWDFVQLTLDQFEKMFPELDGVHRKMRGYGITKVPARKIVTPHGVYRGGYYPLRYDPILDPTVAGFGVPSDPADPMSILRARWGSMDPPTGMTKSRTNHKGAVYLQLEGPLVRGLDDLFTYIAYAEYIRDAKRFLLDPDVALYIRDKIGEGPYNEMMPWLAHQVADPILTSGEAAKLQAFFRQTRLNLQTAIMGASWSTGISQILGNAVSAAEIGMGWQMVGMLKALKSYMTTGFAGVDRDIFQNNEEMRQRVDEVERELRDVMKEVAPFKGGVTIYPRRAYRAYQRLAMHYIGMMDRYGVSVPTYYGAEAKALSEGKSPEVARQLAGKAVRVSQGTGRFMGMARVMRPGSEFQKWLTIAYTYGSVQYNYMKRMIRNFGRGDMSTPEGRDRYQKAFGILLLVFVAATLMQAYLDPNQRPGGRNPNATPDWAQWVIDNIIFGGFLNVMPIVRDAGRGAQRMLESPRHDLNAVADGIANSNPFARLVSASAHAINDDFGNPANPEAIRDHFTAFGLATGAGGSVPAGNALEYLWELHEGAIDSPHNILDFFDGLSRGPPPRRSR